MDSLDSECADDKRNTGKATTTLYRYANKNYHIVTVNTGFGDAPFVSLVQDGQAYDASKIAVDGYTLEGLYKDAECKTKFALNTKITSSQNLYANYTAKSIRLYSKCKMEQSWIPSR